MFGTSVMVQLASCLSTQFVNVCTETKLRVSIHLMILKWFCFDFGILTLTDSRHSALSFVKQIELKFIDFGLTLILLCMTSVGISGQV